MIKRILFILICVVIAAIAAYYAQPSAAKNADLVLVIITVYSVFAGFLIAIIAVLGDPALIPEGSWRVGELRRDSIERRLIWHVYLFMLYLVTIGLLFAGVVIEKAPEGKVSESVKHAVEYGFLFLAVLSFLLSFALPIALMRLQRARVDAEIQRRRGRAGIDDTSNTTS
jgi:hypothetical protein